MGRRVDFRLALATAVLLIVAGLGGVGASGWIGRSFPGFLLLDNGVVASAGLGYWPATREGAIYQQELLSYDGHPLESAKALAAYVADLPPDSPVHYRFGNEGRALERTIRTRVFGPLDAFLLFGSLALTGMAFGLTALGVLYLRGRAHLTADTFPMLFVCAVYALSALDLYGPYHLFRLHALCESVAFAPVLQMALGFPSRSRLARRHPRLLAGPYGAAGLLACATQLGLYQPRVYVAAHLAASLALGVSFLVLVASQLGRYFGPSSFDDRQRIKVVVFGAFGAITPTAFLPLFSVITGGQGSQNVMAFTILAFPVSVGYAVLRHDLLGVDSVLRRSLVYALLTLGVLGTYLGSVALAEKLLHHSLQGEQGLFALGFALLCAGVMLPMRNLVQAGVDRLFFRLAYDDRRALERTSARLASVADLGVIANVLRSAVEETLSPEWSALYVRRRPDGELEALDRTAPPGLDLAQALDRADAACGVFDLEPDGVGVPFFAKGRLLALLLLGRRLSGRLYGGEDRRLLDTLAHQGATAVENSLVLEQLWELNRDLEFKVEERTRALASAMSELRATQAQLLHQAKMASLGQFVAGVAHEINNPLNFIQGHLYCLRESVRRLLEAVHADEPGENAGALVAELEAELVRAFEGCQSGVERTTSLVKDLLIFSRNERPEPTQVDLTQALESTLNLLRDRLKEVTLEKDYATLPAVECLGGQIQQVFLNLLTNAIDAVEGRGRIQVRTLQAGPDRVAVEIEDDGCGIPPEQLDLIFDPFFSTKEVGRGTGLGLAISYGIVGRHGGSIRARSAPGRGTCMRVELSLRLPPVADQPGLS